MDDPVDPRDVLADELEQSGQRGRERRCIEGRARAVLQNASMRDAELIALEVRIAVLALGTVRLTEVAA